MNGQSRHLARRIQEVRLPSGNSSGQTNTLDNSNKPAAAWTRRDRSACDRRQFPYCPPVAALHPRSSFLADCNLSSAVRDNCDWFRDLRFNRDWIRFPFPVALPPPSSPERSAFRIHIRLHSAASGAVEAERDVPFAGRHPPVPGRFSQSPSSVPAFRPRPNTTHPPTAEAPPRVPPSPPIVTCSLLPKVC